MKTVTQGQSIVADGWVRSRNAAEMKVRQDVEAEYAPRLAAATWFGRLILRHRIRREIRCRLEKAAPRDGLYFRPSR